ncbi:DUF262 domain-containing protein [Roseomonas aeriglobus]|nr:DUF262 domain-containing protein [Roseomonas aeriglobus]
MASAVDIIAAIGASLKQASTRALDVSLNEILDMARDGELEVSPDYQRLFRWTEGQQSRFIESLLLEMPVPPIFVIEEDDGRYQLIDGLQRISSYLHLRGQLEAAHLDPPVRLGQKLVLSDCDMVLELNGLSYEDLPTSLQIRLKRAFIRMEVIRKETDPRFKYHMFKRLNTGGEILSDQQVRNASIRMLDNHFPNFLIDLSQIDSFKTCTTALTQERKLTAFDQELVLRFFALKNVREKFKHEVSEFLTDYMERVADPTILEPFDFAVEKAQFEKTFEVLAASLGEFSFSFANKRKDDLSSGFSIYHFEAITIGLQGVIDKLDASDKSQMDLLRDTLRSIKLDAEFMRITSGGGRNSPGPLRDRISFAQERLEHAFG